MPDYATEALPALPDEGPTDVDRGNANTCVVTEKMALYKNIKGSVFDALFIESCNSLL